MGAEQQKIKNLAVRIDEELHTELKKACVEDRTSLQEKMSLIIRNHLRNRRKDRKRKAKQ